MQFIYSPFSLPDEFGFEDKRVFKSTINVCIKAVQDGNVIGRVIACKYPRTMTRAGQWQFGNNRPRALWIDRIDVVKSHRKQGVGRKLMELAVGWLRGVSKGVRQNVYLVATRKTIPFYRKLGWEVIYTDDHSDDEDFPDVYAQEIGQWMALPLGETLHREKEIHDVSSIWCLVDIRYPHVDRIPAQAYRDWVDYCAKDGRDPLEILEDLEGVYHPTKIDVVRRGILAAAL